MRRAIARACAVSTAPLTEISASTVTPSPSSTIWRDSDRQASSTAAAKAASLSALRAIPLTPLASRITVSFVEQSPSTEIALNVSSTAGRRTSIASPGSSG